MKTVPLVFMTSCFAILLLSGFPSRGAGPLPEFTYQGIALHPKDLSWIPTGELEHPSLIKMEGCVENPRARYYLYYAPHKHVGIAVVYSDHIEGPWQEYQGNPVLNGPAAPDIRWIDKKGTLYMVSGAGSKPRLYVVATASAVPDRSRKGSTPDGKLG